MLRPCASYSSAHCRAASGKAGRIVSVTCELESAVTCSGNTRIPAFRHRTGQIEPGLPVWQPGYGCAASGPVNLAEGEAGGTGAARGLGIQPDENHPVWRPGDDEQALINGAVAVIVAAAELPRAQVSRERAVHDQPR